jgi:hypothetical protein
MLLQYLTLQYWEYVMTSNALLSLGDSIQFNMALLKFISIVVYSTIGHFTQNLGL